MKSYSYKVVLKNLINNSNDKIIYYLYQPIIGSIAVSLYFSLINEAFIWNDFKKIVLSNSRLEKLIDIKEGELSKYIKKLEALGLVKTLANKSKQTVIFNVYSPLEPSDFFENRAFNNALIKKIGKNNYDLIRFTFRDEGDLPVESGYCDTSAKFSDVFNELDELIDIKPSCLKAKPRRTNALLSGFNYNQFLIDLESEGLFINKKDKCIKKAIEEIFALYKVDGSLIKDAIKLIYNYDQLTFDLDFLHSTVKELISNKDNSFDEKEYLSNQTNKKIKEMETILPEDYLLALIQTNDPSIVELNVYQLNMIEFLQNKYKLRNAVINCLLDFVYLKNKGNFVTNYIYKIAESMSENGILYASDAYNYLKVAHKKSKKVKSNKSISTNYKKEEQICNDDVVLEEEWIKNFENDGYKFKPSQEMLDRFEKYGFEEL